VRRQRVESGHADEEDSPFPQRAGELPQQAERVDHMFQYAVEKHKLECAVLRRCELAVAGKRRTASSLGCMRRSPPIVSPSSFRQSRANAASAHSRRAPVTTP